MKHRKNSAAQPYLRAFYRGNRLCWAAAMVFTLFSAVPMLLISWALGGGWTPRPPWTGSGCSACCGSPGS